MKPPLPPGTSRYEQFAHSVMHDIASGKYRVGALLPSEPELMAQYGLSRHTIREGVRKLVDMGLVTRQQGVGTRVVAKEAAPQYVAALTSLNELFSYVTDTHLKILGHERVTVDAPLARLLECKPGQRWIRVRTCRFSQSQAEPIAYMVVHFPAEFAAILPYLSKRNTSVYGLIERHFNEIVRDLHQDIRVCAIPADIAAHLGCRPRSPGLHVTRRYRGNGERVLAVSTSIYPESRFHVSMHYRLNWAANA